MSEIRLYKEKGGLNWCLCKIIAEYEDKVWLHNLHTGSMPVKRISSVEFKDASDYINKLKKSNGECEDENV